MGNFTKAGSSRTCGSHYLWRHVAMPPCSSELAVWIPDVTQGRVPAIFKARLQRFVAVAGVS